MLLKEQLLTSGQYSVQKTSNKLFVWGLGTSGQVGSVLYLFSLAQLSAGSSHTVALTSDNRLLAWGLNSSGQLGDNTTVNKSFPQQIGGQGGWKKVSAGYEFTTAIRGDGTLYTWGLNNSGQLGVNDTINRSSPTQAGAGINWNNIDAGSNHALATTTSALLYTWGLNNVGQMGENNIVNRSTPAQIFSIADTSSYTNLITKVGSTYSTSIVPIAGSMSGFFNGSALISAPDSAIFEVAAGDFTVEAFFYATTFNSFNTIIHKGASGVFAPYYILINGSGGILFYSSSSGSSWDIANALNFGTVTTGVWYHVAVSRTSSNLYLFLNGVLQSTINVGVSSLYDNNRVVAIGCRTDGTEGFTGYISNVRIVKGVGVYTGIFTVPTSVLTATQSSGTNISAITGTETSLLLYTTFNSTISQKSFSQISAGLSYSSALDTDYKLFTWGLNTSGQLGDITTVNKSSPVAVGTSSWQLVSTGFGHTAAIQNNSTLYTWGLNDRFQLGLTDTGAGGNTINRSSPTLVTTGSGSGSWKNVSAGNQFTLAISSDLSGPTDNLLFSWGRNQEGQTGFSGTTTNRSVPQQITTGSWSLISAGSSFSVATNDTKLLYNWGSGAGGTQADGITINRSSPVLVSFTSTLSQSSPIQIGVDSWSIISGGNNFFIGLRSDYKLYGWGLNSSGQLGDNTSINKSSPVQIGTSSWTAVSAKNGATTGNNTVLAISTDYKLWGWGVNTIGLTLPVTSWIQVTTGQEHSVALRSDNTVWCWGIGIYGSLGNNSTLNRSSPVQAGSASNWTMVTTTQNQSSGAINSLGELYMWGNNQSGDLGINATTNRSNPTIVPFNTLSWTFVAGTGAITNDGKLWKWGVNSTGAVGDNTTINRSSPVHVGVGTSFTFVTNHLAFTGAIDTTGKLWTWGINTSGSLGTNDVINRSAPVLVSQPVSIQSISWSMVAATDPHMLGLTTTGQLYAWGRNNEGQLGDGTTLSKSTPVQIGSSSWTAIGVMASASMAIDTLGGLFTWGSGANNRLGDAATINKSSPVQIFGGGNFGYSTNGFRILTSSRAGSGRAFVVRSDGAIFGWGDAAQGALGNNTTSSVNSPVLVTNVLASTSSPVLISASTSYTQVSLGVSSAAAIDHLGALYTWGAQNGFGQLGNNSTLNVLMPAKIGTSSWIQVSAGNQYVMAITVDNKLFGWGNNSNYQLGNNTTVVQSSPIQVGTSYAGVAIASWLQVSAGGAFTLAIDSNYKLYGWGLNTFGQLGIVTEAYSWTQLDSGQVFSGAIRQDGTLWFWGTNTNGNLGTQDTAPKSSPTQIGTSSWTQVSVTKFVTNTAGAIRSDGALFLWGLNSAGQLGDNTTINKSSPVQIGSSSWSQVSVGDSHTLAIDAVGRLFGWGLATALNASTAPFSWTVVSENTSHVVAVRSDGLLFTWGLNSSGQLGDSTTVNKISPTQIGNSSWTTASAGTNHVLAITSDYRLFAWGGNAANQLGDNSTVSKSSPVQVVNPSVSWTSVSAANSFSMGITSTNSLYVWGLGTSGQLGTLTEILSWNTLSAGSSNSLAVRNNGRLYGWGLNTGYQLGDGSSITKSSPVQVAGTLSWSAVSAGVNHTLAITDNGELYGWGTATTGATGNYGEVYSWNMVVSSGDNSFFIRSDGSLWATGPNTNGLLGLNDTFARSSPVQVGTSSWIFINAGGQGGQGPVLGITADYKLFSWGDNSGGQLGDGTTINKSSPVQIGIGFSWIQAAAQAGNCLAIRSDYTLWSFGFNFQGRLGLNDLINRSNPTQVGTSSWIAVAAGGAAMAIRSDNTLWTWGLNNFGQLGIGATSDRSSPVQVTTPGTGPWLAIAANENYSLAVSGPGLGTPYSVYFIGGLNLYGQAGLNSTSSSLSLPTLSRAGAAGSSYIQVSTNGTSSQYYSNQALTSDGKIWAWGYNAQGQLGDGTSLAGAKSSPVLVSGSTSWSQLPKQNGETITFGISIDGTLYGWAYAPYYATYNAASVGVSSPIQIGGNIRWRNYNSPIYAINSEAGQGSWTAVAAGNSFSLGIKNSKLYTWGQNSLGQTGNNNTALNPVYSPVQQGTSDWSVVSASELNNFAAAITNDAKLFMWGVNSSGQLGLTDINAGGDTINRSSPIQVGLSSWSAVSTGASHTLAIKADGTLWAWGTNSNYQLGDYSTISRSSPIQISANSWTSVSAGFDHSMAIKSDNTLWGWGNYSLGQVGLITTLYSWNTVSANGNFIVAIRSDGLLFSWGVNTYGQLGTNDTVNRSSPTQIGSNSWIAVAAGLYHTLGITTDNILYAWGLNTSGQLGDNNVISKSSPVLVTTSLSWTKVASNSAHSLAITTDNNLYAWGYNQWGQLGLNAVNNRSTPVYITDAYEVGAGIDFTIFSRYDQVLFTMGQNDYYQLGDNTSVNRSNPTLVSGLNVGPGAAVVYGTPGFSGSGRNGGDGGGNAGTAYAGGIGYGNGGAGFRQYEPSGAGGGGGGGGGQFGGGGGPGAFGNGSGWPGGGGSGFANPMYVTSSSLIAANFSTPAASTDPDRLNAGTAGTTGPSNTTTNCTGGDGAIVINMSAGPAGNLFTSISPAISGLTTWTAADGNIGLYAYGTYTFTAAQTFSVNVKVWGAGGGVTTTTANRTGGAGGFAGGIVTFVSGAQYRMIVGQGGAGGSTTAPGAQAGGGGAGSGLEFLNTTSILVAGGGGGGAWAGNAAGGGGLAGQDTSGVDVRNGISAQSGGTVSWTSVSGGLRVTGATNSAYTLYMWGYSQYGQVGNNSVNIITSPIIIGSTTSWATVSCGYWNTLAKTAAGSLFAWGRNYAGNLGVNNLIDFSSPVQVSSLSWGTISAGIDMMASIQNNYLYTWGNGGSGQIGIGQTSSRSSPTLIGNNIDINTLSPVQIGSSSWSQVSAGNQFTLARDINGNLYTWGQDTSGQLGF